jgi:hypothetical protein
MIALDGALRRLTVCQLTRDRAENGGGLRPRVWLRLRAAAAWGQLDPGWNLTIGRRSQFLLVLGHMKRTQASLASASTSAADCGTCCMSMSSGPTMMASGRAPGTDGKLFDVGHCKSIFGRTYVTTGASRDGVSQGSSNGRSSSAARILSSSATVGSRITQKRNCFAFSDGLS